MPTGFMGLCLGLRVVCMVCLRRPLTETSVDISLLGMQLLELSRTGFSSNGTASRIEKSENLMKA